MVLSWENEKGNNPDLKKKKKRCIKKVFFGNLQPGKDVLG